MSEGGCKTTVEVPLVSAVVTAFICFYLVGGWERIDCALGVKEACEQIETWNPPKALEQK